MTTESSGTAAVRRVARRVGDPQRREHAEVLADAFVKGELSRVEFDARTELCLAAVTDADLAQLVADLAEQRAEVLARPGASQGAVHLARFAGFEVVLMVVAYVLAWTSRARIGLGISSPSRSGWSALWRVRQEPYFVDPVSTS